MCDKRGIPEPTPPSPPVSVKSELVPGGATREVRGTDYSQISHVALRLIAETQDEGNKRYGYGNWQKGLPVSNLLSHAIEHIMKLQNGFIDENHLGHALWNLEKAAHFIETRPDLIDVLPMRRARGLDNDVYISHTQRIPVDPNPYRNTLCFFCGRPVEDNHYKVIPPNNPYRQAHVACFVEAAGRDKDTFNTEPGK